MVPEILLEDECHGPEGGDQGIDCQKMTTLPRRGHRTTVDAARSRSGATPSGDPVGAYRPGHGPLAGGAPPFGRVDRPRCSGTRPQRAARGRGRTRRVRPGAWLRASHGQRRRDPRAARGITPRIAHRSPPSDSPVGRAGPPGRGRDRVRSQAPTPRHDPRADADSNRRLTRPSRPTWPVVRRDCHLRGRQHGGHAAHPRGDRAS